jgi:hypothetical protein
VNAEAADGTDASAARTQTISDDARLSREPISDDAASSLIVTPRIWTAIAPTLLAE